MARLFITWSMPQATCFFSILWVYAFYYTLSLMTKERDCAILISVAARCIYFLEDC